MTLHKCECPFEANGGMPESWYTKEELSGRVHKANECKGTNEVKLYLRDGKELWLCSCCNMTGDIEVEKGASEIR